MKPSELLILYVHICAFVIVECWWALQAILSAAFKHLSIWAAAVIGLHQFVTCSQCTKVHCTILKVIAVIFMMCMATFMSNVELRVTVSIKGLGFHLYTEPCPRQCCLKGLLSYILVSQARFGEVWWLWPVLVQTHQSSEYAPPSCAAQNLSWCWKKENFNVGMNGDSQKRKS